MKAKPIALSPKRRQSFQHSLEMQNSRRNPHGKQTTGSGSVCQWLASNPALHNTLWRIVLLQIKHTIY